jgi:hypothetical protein
MPVYPQEVLRVTLFARAVYAGINQAAKLVRHVKQRVAVKPSP